MKLFLIFAFSLLVWALLVALYGYKQFEYIPFLGNVQYFCSRAGVEYLYLERAQTLALAVDQSGKPINCESRGVHL